METIATMESQLRTNNLTLVAATYPSSKGDLTGPTGVVAKTPKATAEVYQGRWLAKCPFPGCYGAEYVNMTAGLFFCCECRNAAVGHALVQVVIPAAKEQIEAVLLERPQAENQNWLVGETVAALTAENVASLKAEE